MESVVNQSLSPVLMLIIGLVVLAFLLWLFYPNKGGMALIERLKSNNKRVLLEDALKYIFDCEYKKVPCKVEMLSGRLAISDDNAIELVERLVSLELITLKDNDVHLTDTGRSYALRVIRVHRIWERYLADETSVSQLDWHSEADVMEHRFTTVETEQLASKIGHPVFDPHGDPIPTKDGKMPRQKGIGLNKMEEGETGIITHMEDEPHSIYEQLVVLGIYPGMEVYVTDVKDNKITFAANGDELQLTPLFAKQITVEKLELSDVPKEKFDLLSSLNIGETATVMGISQNCLGQQRRRLMDLGIVPGSTISSKIKSASGDPVGYRVLGTTIGIRKKEADLIFINKNIEHEQSA